MIRMTLLAALLASASACTDDSDDPSPVAAPAAPATPPPTYDAQVAAAVADATDLYVVGSDRATTLGDSQWRLEKQTLYATLNPSFGTGGAIVENLTASDDRACAVVLDGDALLIAGSAGGAWRIERRLRSSGALVPAFGVDGAITSDPTAGVDSARAAVLVGGSLYVAGSQGGAWRVEKRDAATGQPDPAFAVVSDPTAGTDDATAIASDGLALFIAGAASGAWRIEKRALSDGSLLAAVTSDPTAGDDVPTAVVSAGGSIYLAGWDAGGAAGSNQWRLEKRSAVDLVLEAVEVSDLTAGDDRALALAIEGSTLYLSGCDQGAVDGGLRWRIEKRDAASLALLPAVEEPGVDGEATALVVDAAGGLIIAGGNRADANLAWAVRATDK
jgi:hypothetical protein